MLILTHLIACIFNFVRKKDIIKIGRFLVDITDEWTLL